MVKQIKTEKTWQGVTSRKGGWSKDWQEGQKYCYKVVCVFPPEENHPLLLCFLGETA